MVLEAFPANSIFHLGHQFSRKPLPVTSIRKELRQFLQSSFVCLIKAALDSAIDINNRNDLEDLR